MATPAAVLNVLVTANTKQAQMGLANVQRQLVGVDAAGAKAAAGTERATKATGGLGKTAKQAAGMAGIGGLALGVVGMVKTAAGFEQQMSSLAAVTEANGKTMKQFREQALKAGKDTAFSAREAAVAQTELAKGGMSVADIMKGGLKGALALAAAGELELGDAASTTANALNLFKLKGEQAGHVADALAMAANATTADVGDFGRALTQGGAAAKAAGLNFDETIVWLEALATAGIKGSDAGTSMKSALTQIAAPAKKAKETMKETGLQFFDAQGNFKDLADISAMLRKQLGGLSKEQQLATVKNIAGTDGMRGLLAIMDAGPEVLREYGKGLEKQGTAAAVAAKKQDNLAGKWEEFTGGIETLVIQLSAALLPVMTKVVVALGKFVDVVITVVPHVLSLVKTIAKLVPYLAPLVAGFVAFKAALAVSRAVDTLRLGMATLRTVFIAQTGVTNASTVAVLRHAAASKISAAAAKVMAGAQAALNAVMALNPVVLVVAALVALAAGLVLAYKKSETFRKIVDGAFDGVKKAAEVMWDVFKSIFEWVKDHWKLLASILTGPIGAALIQIITHLDDIKDAVGAAWDWIKRASTTAWNAIKTALRTVWNAIKTVAVTLWAGIKTAIISPISATGDWLGARWATIKGALTTVWNTIKTVAGTAWTGIKDAIMAPVRSAASLVRNTLGEQGLAGWLGKVWDKIVGGAEDFASSIKDKITGAFNGVAKAVGEVAGLILKVIDQIPGVNLKGPRKSIKAWVDGLAEGGRYQAMARGGAFARTGGLVKGPITLMGEEAPRHPEFVIPTNPAYRKRAQMLAMQAAGAVGLAQGGVWGRDQLAALWSRVNPGLGDPKVMAAIALAESSGRQGAIGHDPGGTKGLGLWQITTGFNSDLINKHGGFDAMLDSAAANARAAGDILRRQGLGAWVVYNTGAFKQFMGDSGGGGFLGKIVGGIAGLPGIVGDLVKGGAGFLLNQLPNPMDYLPDWMKGTGKWMISKASSFIKGKVGQVLDSAGILGNDYIQGKVSGDVGKAIALAAGLGFAHPSQNQITGGKHAKGSLHYSGRAVDFGDAGHTQAQMENLFMRLYKQFGSSINELFYDRMPWHINDHRQIPGPFGGHMDHIHIGFAQGGRYAALANGGRVRGAGWAVVGEHGPELAHLPSGASVYSHRESAGMVGGHSGLAAAVEGLRQEVGRLNGFNESLVGRRIAEVNRALAEVVSGQLGPDVAARGLLPGDGARGRY